jgi:hypothetical protein
VDDAHNIWLHDYHSAFGTAVEHNRQNGTEVRRKETWLLRFPATSKGEFSGSIIHCGRFAIRIDFPNHKSNSPRYVENLQAFTNKHRAAAEKSMVGPPSVEALGLHTGPSTQAPSEAVTPLERLIYYEVEEIGAGAYGKVMRTIRARDGTAFASKTFRPPSNRNKRRRDDPDPKWLMNIRSEFTIMKDHPHVSLAAPFAMWPRFRANHTAVERCPSARAPRDSSAYDNHELLSTREHCQRQHA